jgi:hypothetical protein
VLIFEIPVLSEAKQYNFYNPTSIPIFSQSEVHIPKLDAQYIAISKSGSKYYAMTAEEFRQCKTQPNECYIRRPARPLNDKSSCTIISYTMDNLQCPVEKAAHPEEYPPFFPVDGNRVIFAVNGSLTMYIKCQEHRHTSQYTDTTLKIENHGEVTLRSSCSVTLLDGSTFNTSSISETTELTELPIYDILTMLPKPTGYVISNNNQSIMINTTIFVKPEPTVEPELTLEQLIENAFKPKTSMSFVMLLSIFLVILRIIAFMLYCCKHRIMQCLKRAGFKKPNPNKPSRLFEKHQAEVKKQCNSIGKNVHQIQSDITSMFRAIPKIQETPTVVPAVPLPRPPIQPALNIRDSTIFEADLSNSLMDLQNGARQQEND